MERGICIRIRIKEMQIRNPGFSVQLAVGQRIVCGLYIPCDISHILSLYKSRTHNANLLSLLSTVQPALNKKLSAISDVAEIFHDYLKCCL